MRLAVSFFILLITMLDLCFGHPELGLQLAGMVAGVLLALSVIVDHLFPMNSKPPEPADPSVTPLATPTRTGS